VAGVFSFVIVMIGLWACCAPDLTDDNDDNRPTLSVEYSAEMYSSSDCSQAQRIAGSQAQRIAGSQAQQIGLEDIYRASSTDNPNPALNGTLDQLRGLNQAQQIAALTGMVSDLTGMVYQLQAGSNEAERSSSTYLSTDNPPPYSAEMYSSSDRSQAQQIAGLTGTVYQLQARLNEAERSSSPSDQTNPGSRTSSLYYLQ